MPARSAGTQNYSIHNCYCCSSGHFPFPINFLILEIAVSIASAVFIFIESRHVFLSVFIVSILVFYATISSSAARFSDPDSPISEHTSSSITEASISSLISISSWSSVRTFTSRHRLCISLMSTLKDSGIPRVPEYSHPLRWLRKSLHDPRCRRILR